MHEQCCWKDGFRKMIHFKASFKPLQSWKQLKVEPTYTQLNCNMTDWKLMQFSFCYTEIQDLPSCGNPCIILPLSLGPTQLISPPDEVVFLNLVIFKMTESQNSLASMLKLPRLRNRAIEDLISQFFEIQQTAQHFSFPNYCSIQFLKNHSSKCKEQRRKDLQHLSILSKIKIAYLFEPQSLFQ